MLPTGAKSLANTLSGYDLVLVLGAPVFRYHAYEPGTYLSTDVSLVAITPDPGEAARAPIGDALVADAGLTLDGLLDLLETSNAADQATLKPRQRPTAADDAVPLSPEAVYDALDGILPLEAVVVNESTSDKTAFWERVTDLATEKAGSP